MKKYPPDHAERTRQGLAKAAAKGRKPGRQPKLTEAQVRAVIPLGTVKGAKKLKVSVSTFIRHRRRIEEGAESV